jgi:hypothetical protein
MLIDIYEALRGFFAHKAVSDYLFPITSGVYITFVTVRIVQFQDAKRYARKELEMIEATVLSAPTNLRVGEWNSLINSFRSRFVGSLSEFKTLRHEDAAEKIDNLVSQITGSLMTALAKTEVPELRLKTKRSPEELEQIIRENEGLSFRQSVNKSMQKELPVYYSEIDRLPISWKTIFGTSGGSSLIASMVATFDSRLHLEQKRAVSPCEKCGKNPARVI